MGIPVARGVLKAGPSLGLLSSPLLAAVLNRYVDRGLGPLLRRHLTGALDPDPAPATSAPGPARADLLAGSPPR
ncbi:hypothetical protein [Streptomyces sp. NPDC029003]|uniref:hypothetical protein n=1 Tax=Streptomyces sp. NPDC029003 TaxID=3155125 RepID=UPI0033CF2295